MRNIFKLLNLVLFIFIISSVVQAQTPKTELVLHSEQGDFIGRGKDYRFTEADSDFDVSVSKRNNSGVTTVSFGVRDKKTSNGFSIDFDSTFLPNRSLTLGLYSTVQAYPFEEPCTAGLSVSGMSRGCSEVTGKFVIFDAKFDFDKDGKPSINSFGARFEQHCDGIKPALFGIIYYKTTLEPDIENPKLNNLAFSKNTIKNDGNGKVVISWNATDNIKVDHIDLLFAVNGKTFLTKIANDLPSETNNFTWTVPENLPKTKVGRVKVIVFDSSGNSTEAISQTTLTIN